MSYPGGYILIYYLFQLKGVQLMAFVFLLVFTIGLFVGSVIVEFAPTTPETPLDQAWAEKEAIYNKNLPIQLKAWNFLCNHAATTIIVIYLIPVLIFLIYNRMTKSRRQEEIAKLLEERAKLLEALEIATRVRLEMAASEAKRKSPGN